MKIKGFLKMAGIIAAAGLLLAGCGSSAKVKLDPDNPVTVTIWHYYNGMQQSAFDELVDEFNNTVGREQGIFVNGHSQGKVEELEATVQASINKEVGSEDVPNIFSSYADTAYAVEKMGLLADLSQYMTKDELDTYVDSFVDEGRIGDNGELKIFPTAKSSEVLMMNKNVWDVFSQAAGVSLDDLKTMEGLVLVAQKYYEWTDAKTPDIPDDGKAFYGRDALANLFIIGSKQLGKDIFAVENGKVTLNVDKDIMKRIWDCYYVPLVKGYFGAYGRFRSDDLKIGQIIAFTGSSTSSMYFPTEVEIEDTKEPIDAITLPTPIFEGGENYAVQQGAGMVVTKGTKEEEYASIEFLKWFTQKENNMQFACTSGYLPVQKEACSQEALDTFIQESGMEISSKTYDGLLVGFDTINNGHLYTNKAFDNGTNARKILEYNLADKAAADRAAVEESLGQGKSLTEAAAPFISDEAFNQWFDTFNTALEDAVAGK